MAYYNKSASIYSIQLDKTNSQSYLSKLVVGQCRHFPHKLILETKFEKGTFIQMSRKLSALHFDKEA